MTDDDVSLCGRATDESRRKLLCDAFFSINSDPITTLMDKLLASSALWYTYGLSNYARECVYEANGVPPQEIIMGYNDFEDLDLLCRLNHSCATTNGMCFADFDELRVLRHCAKRMSVVASASSIQCFWIRNWVDDIVPDNDKDWTVVSRAI
jgi:hypothetical protein